jgi:hypothetical protein
MYFVLLPRSKPVNTALYLPHDSIVSRTRMFCIKVLVGPEIGNCDRSIDYLIDWLLFFFSGATAPIWALAYLNETLRFTSVFSILDSR